MGHSGPLDAPIVLCGRDYGFEEQRAGRPFVGPAGKLLSRALAKAGIEREQCLITNVVNARPAGNKWEAHSDADIERGVAELHDLLGRRGVRNALIVALGAESFQACRGLDPRTRPEVEFDGNGITELRGYCFDGPFGPVLASTHPAFILRTWLPWWPCLCWDLAKAKRQMEKLPVKVISCAPITTEWIVNTDWSEYREFPEDIPFALDIETAGPHAEEIRCVGLSWNGKSAVVWPFNEDTRETIGEVMGTPNPKIFHNGQFDVTILEKHGLRVNNWTDDTMILWHVVEPLLAGKKKEKGDETVKSLRFLASLLTDEPWYKDYRFNSPEDQLRLCAKDSRITWACWDKLRKMLEGEHHERLRDQPVCV